MRKVCFNSRPDNTLHFTTLHASGYKREASRIETEECFGHRPGSYIGDV